jgi:hypothetical protein
MTEFTGDLEAYELPALVRVRAYRFNRRIYGREYLDQMVVEYEIGHPDGFTATQVDMSAHESALRTHHGELRSKCFNDVEKLAFNLIEVCLNRNLTGFASLVQKEMQRRLPGVADADIQAAYGHAYDKWVEAYSK